MFGLSWLLLAAIIALSRAYDPVRVCLEEEFFETEPGHWVNYHLLCISKLTPLVLMYCREKPWISAMNPEQTSLLAIYQE